MVLKGLKIFILQRNFRDNSLARRNLQSSQVEVCFCAIRL